MTEEMRVMKQLIGPFWFASRRIFLKPGIYWCGSKSSHRILALPSATASIRLVEFPEQTVVIAKNQPEYNPLPAHHFGDAEGRIACCWRLSLSARVKVLLSGKVWHQILTFNQPLQPQLLTVEKPEMKT